MLENILDRLVPIFFLVPTGYTVFYFFPRYYNFPKYKCMQLIFLIGFLMLGILLIPIIITKKDFSSNFSSVAFFIGYDCAILFFSMILFRWKIDSTTIFFVTIEDLKKLMDGVLRRIGWTDIQIMEDGIDSIQFSDPNQNFSIHVIQKSDRFIVWPKATTRLKESDTRVIRRFSTNLKYDLPSYPPNKEMEKIFRQKNTKFLLALWGLFIILQLVRILFFRG